MCSLEPPLLLRVKIRCNVSRQMGLVKATSSITLCLWMLTDYRSSKTDIFVVQKYWLPQPATVHIGPYRLFVFASDWINLHTVAQYISPPWKSSFENTLFSSYANTSGSSHGCRSSHTTIGRKETPYFFFSGFPYNIPGIGTTSDKLSISYIASSFLLEVSQPCIRLREKKVYLRSLSLYMSP